MSPAQSTEQNSTPTSLPWYVMASVMLVLTLLIIVFYSAPLNTSPDQTYDVNNDAAVLEE